MEDEELEREILWLEIQVNGFKMSLALGGWHDREEWMEHRTNLRKLYELKKLQNENWRKKWNKKNLT